MGTTVFERQPPSPSVIDASLRDTDLRVFWLDDVDRPTHPRLNGTVRADLAIVGGGYAVHRPAYPTTTMSTSSVLMLPPGLGSSLPARATAAAG
ncbi:hypothetical protein [Microbacterium sp. BF1]|uniref:hypothetical protein n=1 Tax=Microbacterium sp. BF1 TaxID=2821146 RepID=UPI002119CA67|nr:hypothetical protein [Microbacterium sp. BF1]